MKQYRISPLMLMLMAAFIVIDGSWFAVYAVICALFHESWHIIALKIYGGKATAISFSGCGISLKTASLSYGREAAVALAGPLASLFACAVFAFISRYIVFSKETVFFAASNLAVFLINIVPVYPLDGGRALYCLICMKTHPQRAAFIMKIISAIFLLPIGVLSVIILIRTGYNLSLLIICIYLALLLIGVLDI